MADGGEGPRDQLNALLAPWGVSFGTGSVSDLSSLADDPGSVVAADYPSNSPLTERLRERELPVVMINAVPVEPSAAFRQDGHFSPLVRSSPKSWIKPAGLKGPFVLAGVADHSRLAGGNENPTVAR